ncbi:hypothetical protein DL98DRAFT_532415 [Cadophora sp. DSE1049]|nr:hypothetical protein DL98DRAFT_532415 [Cadophora sp. DSE1049]
MPELDASNFNHIGRLPEKQAKESLPAPNETVKSILSTSAAVPAGLLGGPGGACLGLVGLCVIAPFGGPALIVGSVLASRTVMGTVTAMGAGAGLGKLYDDTHRKE